MVRVSDFFKMQLLCYPLHNRFVACRYIITRPLQRTVNFWKSL